MQTKRSRDDPDAHPVEVEPRLPGDPSGRARSAFLIAFWGGAGVVATSVALAMLAPETGLRAQIVLAVLGVTAALVAVLQRCRASESAQETSPGFVLLVAGLLPAACLVFATRLAAGDAAVARSGGLAALCWLGATATATATVRVVASPGEVSEHRWTRGDLGGLLLLFAVALVPRMVALGRLPANFDGDEGQGGLVAAAFAEGTADNLFGIGWFSFPSLFFALESLGILVDGRSVEAIRSVAAVGGALTVVVVAVLGRLVAGPLAGWIAGGFLAASHFHLHFSRLALANVWDGFFAASACAALLWGWRSGNRAAFALCGIALGLGQYFYVSMRAMPAAFLVWCAMAWMVDRERFARRRGGLFGAAWVAAMVAGPIALFYVDHFEDFKAPLHRVTIFGTWMENEILASGRTVAAILADQVAAAASGTVTRPLKGGFYVPGAPMLLPGAAALFVLGLTVTVLRPSLARLVLLLPLLAVLIANTLSLEPPTAQRMVMAAPFVAVLIAIPLVIAAAGVQRFGLHRPAAVGAVAITAVISVTEVRFYFSEAYKIYVVGGTNAEAATELARYLTEPDQKVRHVVFIGRPRMGYASHATVPYLAPGVTGVDLMEPLTRPPADRPPGPAAFVLLPERRGELDHIRTAFPDGRVHEVLSRRGEPLFTVYEID